MGRTSGTKLLPWAAFLLFVYPPAAGYLAANAACWLSGGDNVDVRRESDGYYHSTGYPPCRDCIDDLAAGRFRFVDYQVVNPDSNDLVEDAGLYRYELHPVDSDACKPYLASARWMRDAKRWGIGDGQCVAATPVDEPSRYEYRRIERRALTPFGVILDVIDNEVVDNAGSVVLAKHSTYRHSAYYYDWLAFPGPTVCSGGAGTFRPGRFREAALTGLRTTRP